MMFTLRVGAHSEVGTPWWCSMLHSPHPPHTHLGNILLWYTHLGMPATAQMLWELHSAAPSPYLSAEDG